MGLKLISRTKVYATWMAAWSVYMPAQKVSTSSLKSHLSLQSCEQMAGAMARWTVVRPHCKIS